MKPFLILISSFAFFYLILVQILSKKEGSTAQAGRWAMACMLFFMASRHFIFTERLSYIIPDFLPQSVFIIYLSGIVQFIFGCCLFVSSIKVPVGWLLMLFFIIIIPANAKALLENINFLDGQNMENSQAIYFLIPMHLIYIFWTFFCTVGDEKEEEFEWQG